MSTSDDRSPSSTPRRRPVLVALLAIPAMTMITIRALAGSVAETVRDPATRGIGIVAVGVIVVATLFFNWVEGWGLLNSLYFSVITLATVGYGDFTPKTDLGKMGAIVTVVFGVGIIAVFFGGIARRAGDRAANRARTVRKRFEGELARVEEERAGLGAGAGRDRGPTAAEATAEERGATGPEG